MATKRAGKVARRHQPMTVAAWYREGHFANESEAQGAFKLAYQQWLDGMGGSPYEWMGLTPKEFDSWVRDGALPKKKR